jgi:hypothetical protein
MALFSEHHAANNSMRLCCCREIQNPAASDPALTSRLDGNRTVDPQRDELDIEFFEFSDDISSVTCQAVCRAGAVVTRASQKDRLTATPEAPQGGFLF